MGRLNGNIRPNKHCGCLGCVSGNTYGELSVEGDGAGKGKIWVYASGGNPSAWISFDRVSFIPKNVDTTKISSFLNSWTNVGSVYQTAGYYVNSEGILMLEGTVKNGSFGGYIFNLPGASESYQSTMYPVLDFFGANIVTGVVNLTNSGVYAVSGANTRLHLDGIINPRYKSWTAPTMLNNWATIGSGWRDVGYWKDSNGIVHLTGIAERLTTGGANGTILFTLPAGYRPVRRMLFPSVCYINSLGSYQWARIDVDTSGNVIFYGDNTYTINILTLCGLRFFESGVSRYAIPKMARWEAYSGTYTESVYRRFDDFVHVNGMLKNGGNLSYALHLPFNAKYTQAEIVSNENYVKNQDFNEVRTYGNLGRTDRGLSAINWTDAAPVTDNPILKSHMEDLRSVCNGQVSYGGSDYSFTDPVIVRYVTEIRASHMNEIRQVIDDAGFWARCKSACSSYCGQICASSCSDNCSTSCNTTCSGDCQSGCTLSCRDSCSYRCHTSCSTTCGSTCSGTCALNSCSGTCSGSSCSGTCGSSCTKSCTPSCSGWCYGGFMVDAFCTDNCWTTPCGDVCWAGCGGTCATGCSNQCRSTCAGRCIASCALYCHTTCSASCGDTCNATCESTCSQHCYSDCTTECGLNCTTTCSGDCSFGCIGNCYNTCMSSCYSSCAESARIGADPGGY